VKGARGRDGQVFLTNRLTTGAPSRKKKKKKKNDNDTKELCNDKESPSKREEPIGRRRPEFTEGKLCRGKTSDDTAILTRPPTGIATWGGTRKKVSRQSRKTTPTEGEKYAGGGKRRFPSRRILLGGRAARRVSREGKKKLQQGKEGIQKKRPQHVGRDRKLKKGCMQIPDKNGGAVVVDRNVKEVFQVVPKGKNLEKTAKGDSDARKRGAQNKQPKKAPTVGPKRVGHSASKPSLKEEIKELWGKRKGITW